MIKQCQTYIHEALANCVGLSLQYIKTLEWSFADALVSMLRLMGIYFQAHSASPGAAATALGHRWDELEDYKGSIEKVCRFPWSSGEL